MCKTRPRNHRAGQAVKVLWSGPARRALREISLYIAERDPVAAIKLLDRFTEAGRILNKFPLAGPTGRIPETRELFVHRHFLLVYEVKDNILKILNILHTSQQYPPLE